MGARGVPGVDSAAVAGPTVPAARVPVRTCVGCRARAAEPELVRVVAVRGACVPDPAARLPGRGAYLHPDPACLDLAERRRALPRALRVPGRSPSMRCAVVALELDSSTHRRWADRSLPQSVRGQERAGHEQLDEPLMSTPAMSVSVHV